MSNYAQAVANKIVKNLKCHRYSKTTQTQKTSDRQHTRRSKIKER